MKKTSVDQAIDVLAAEHGRREAEKFRVRLTRDMNGMAEKIGTYASPYSLPIFSNETGFVDHAAETKAVTFQGIDGSKSTSAGRARQVAAMKKYWAKKRKAAK